MQLNTAPTLRKGSIMKALGESLFWPIGALKDLLFYPEEEVSNYDEERRNWAIRNIIAGILGLVAIAATFGLLATGQITALYVGAALIFIFGALVSRIVWTEYGGFLVQLIHVSCLLILLGIIFGALLRLLF